MSALSFDYLDHLQWLEQHEPNAIVGRRNQAMSCPFATYAGEMTGKQYNIGYDGCYPFDGYFEITPMRGWLSSYTHLVDNCVEGEVVTACEAIDLLRSALTEDEFMMLPPLDELLWQEEQQRKCDLFQRGDCT